MVELLKEVDERQHNHGDWRSNVYIEQKEKDKVDVVYEALYFRRSAGSEVHDPVHQAEGVGGAGLPAHRSEPVVLRSRVGKWERRTERERIGGTNSRRSDFDESRLAEEYDPTDEGEEKLGAYTAQMLMLKGKPGLDLAFPVIKLWVDKDTQERAQAPGVSRCRASCCARRTIRSGRRSSASRRRATSGTRKRSASSTRSRRRTRR